MNNRNFTLPACLVILIIALQNPCVSNSKLNPVVLILHFVIERGEVTEYKFLCSKDDKDLVYEFWFYQTPEKPF